MVIASFENVGFTYAFGDSPALVDVDLSIEPGLLYGIIGANTSGKTTLCNLIRGVIPHFYRGELTGRATVLGRELADWDPAELSRTIGYVFQNPFTQISGIKDTVFEEIGLGLENLGVARDEIIDRVVAVVTELGLESLIRKNPNELSGGQRQKVAFASVVVMDAEVLVIDEPTSQLDPESSEEIFGVIQRLKQRGKSIVLVEHKIDLLAEHADRLVVLHAGRVAMEGTTQEVLVSTAPADAGVPRPQVTDLALALAEAGRPLSEIPVTADAARRVISQRLKENSRVDRAV